MLQDGKSKQGSQLDGSQLNDSTVSAFEEDSSSAADRAADTSKLAPASSEARPTPSPAQEAAKASSSTALPSAPSSLDETAAIPASSRQGGSDGKQAVSSSSPAAATKNVAPTGAASGSPAGSSPKAFAGFKGQLQDKTATVGRASTSSAAVQSPAGQAASETAPVQSPISQAASETAAEGPIPKTQQHRKPAIWAAATVTGRPRNSPSLPPKPKDPQPSPTAPYKSSAATQSAAQNEAHSAGSRQIQSQVQRVEYVTRPQIDPLGRPTGGVEVVPASMVPTGTAPFGLTPVGITPPPPKSSSATQSNAAQISAQGRSQDAGSSLIQSHVQRVEYVARPQIDPLGRPTGQVEVVPASMVPTGTAPYGLTPVGISPSASKSSSAVQSIAQSKGQDAASSPTQPEVRRVEYVGRPQIDPLGHPTGQVELVPAGSVPTGTTPGGTTPARTTPLTSVPSEATPVGTTPAGTTPAGTTSSGGRSGDAVSGNVVSVSEALSQAAEKARDVSSKTGATPNQPGASSSKPGAVPKQAGAEPDRAGAGVGASDDQGWRQSKLERSTSWKTR